MDKGEPIVIVRVSNGLIVNPKEISGVDRNDLDKKVSVFVSVEDLCVWIKNHFGNLTKGEIEK